MKFFGTIVGRLFSSVKAELPSDLYWGIRAVQDLRMDNVCYWVLVKAESGNTVLMKVLLSIHNYFDRVCDLLEDEMCIMFKRRPCNLPNSSPNPSPSKAEEAELAGMKESLPSMLVEISTLSTDGTSSIQFVT
jgi:hypothetical protein